MFPASRLLPILCASAALAGCGRTPPSAQAEPQPAAAGDYAVPPAVTSVHADAKGVSLGGTAGGGVQVRLGSPTGGALLALADVGGRWSVRLPPSAEVRIFGLSEKVGGRQAQGQGYVVVTPEGRAALLRAGSGALRLDSRRTPSLGAVDFDNEDGVVISGLAPPSSLVFLRVDGRQLAEARVDGAGRYAIVLSQPIHGAHALEVAGDTFANAGQVEVSPAQPLAAGPLRSQFTKGGRRIDWLTPGGGVQTTVLLD